MKIYWFKCVLALLVSALLGLLCFKITKDVDSHKWISMVVSWISIFICLVSATGFDIPEKRIVNIKVAAWLFTALVVLTNLIFSCFVYEIVIYIVIVGLLVLLDVWIIYVLYPKQQS